MEKLSRDFGDKCKGRRRLVTEAGDFVQGRLRKVSMAKGRRKEKGS